jgi:integrase
MSGIGLSPRCGRSPPRTSPQCSTLPVLPPTSSTSTWAARDVATIDVLAFARLRAAEFGSLQIRDIGGTDRPILHIRRGAKGNERREIPLPQHTTERLDASLAEQADRGLRGGPRTDLFVRNEGTALSTDSLYHLVLRRVRSRCIASRRRSGARSVASFRRAVRDPRHPAGVIAASGGPHRPPHHGSLRPKCKPRSGGRAR